MQVDTSGDKNKKNMATTGPPHPLTTWLTPPIPPASPFPVTNLPYGIFSRAADGVPCPGVAVGDDIILDLAALTRGGLLPVEAGFLVGERDGGRLPAPTLNAFMASGPPTWDAVRAALTSLICGDPPADTRLSADPGLRAAAVVHRGQVAKMHLPAAIGDFTDFYASREHATNCGSLFRDPAAALPPNWLHLPIAYHGRASTVGVSPAAVVRPLGQLPPRAPLGAPSFGPSARLDFELEVGVFIGGAANAQGTRVRLGDAPGRVFGFVLLNDWSARDVQRWEMAPLGPFAGKNFATTVSPWVVSPAALAPWAVPAPVQADPAPPAYLREDDGDVGGRGMPRLTFDLPLTVRLGTAATAAAAPGPPGHLLATSNLRHLYWTPAQMVAHHTAGGCALRPGDLVGTGTISGPGGVAGGGLGSLLEASLDGRAPVALAGGEARTFLEDGDTVVLSGMTRATADGWPGVGFGECRGVVVGAPAP